MAMPASVASRGEWKRMGRPLTRISPSSGRMLPARIFISVDLPAPFSPIRACTVPGRIRRLTPSSATTPGYRLVMPSASRRYSGMAIASARPASSFTMADAIVIPPSNPGFVRVKVRTLPHRYCCPGAGPQRLKGSVGNDRRSVAVPGTRPGGGARDGCVDPLLELKVERADETLPPVGRHPAAECTFPLQHHWVAFGERRDARLAHDLAPDVVAIG